MKPLPPPITVLMPIRNGQDWIRDSITSILQQDFQDFEILIVNDGSSDDSISIAQELGGSRVRVITGSGDGLAKALALGVVAAESEIIARMDVDDVADHKRLKWQLAFLHANPNHVLVGTNVNLIDMQGRRIGKSHLPLTDEAIRKRMAIANPFAHSSVAFRRSAVLTAGNYKGPHSGPFPEDYHLWSRLLRLGAAANLDARLLNYRINEKGVSFVNKDTMASHSAAIAWKWFASNQSRAREDERLSQAWISCFSSNERLSLRNATLVTKAMLRIETPRPPGSFGRGFRLRHYLIPFKKVLQK